MSPDNQYQLLIEKLDRFIRKYYINQIIKGLMQFFAVLLISFLIANIIEYFTEGSSAGRTVLFFSFMVVNLAAFIAWVAWPATKLMRIGKIISHEQASAIIGKHFPNVQDKLLNTLQLKQASAGSKALIEASIAQKVLELKPIPFNVAIDFRKNRKYLKYAVIPLLVIVAIMIQVPNVVLDSSARILSYNQEFIPTAPFNFLLQNEKMEVLMHENFAVELKLEGQEIPENAYIEVDGNSFKMVKEGKQFHHYTLKNVDQSKTLQFKANGWESQRYELKVLPKPFLKGFKVSLEYPDYTAKPAKTLENIGDLNIPEGTKVRWTFEAENTDELTFAFADNKALKAQRRASNTFTMEKVFKASQRYFIYSTNQYTRSDSIGYDINVQADAHPSIKVEMERDSNSYKTYFFQGEIADDYGLTALNFYHRFSKSEDKAKVSPSFSKQPIGITKSNPQNFFHFWDLRKLNYQAGDEMEFYFVVWDNDAVNGHKSSKSQTFTLRAPDKNDMREMVAETSSDIKQNMQNLMKEAADVQKDLQNVRNRIMNKKQLNWEDQQAIKQLLQKQQDLDKQIKSMNKEYDEMLKKQDEFSEMDERIREKHEQLQELFEKLMTEEMKELYDELEKMLEERQDQNMQQELEDMEMQNEELEKELDIALEQFKQLEFEQKLEETIQQMEELEEKQRELNQKTENKEGSNEQLKQQQDALNREFEKLQEEMEKMREMNKELERPNAMPETSEEEENIEKEMQESSEQLQNNKPGKAGENQKKAADEMKKAKEKMQAMQQKMEQESLQLNYQALRQILENLMHLSFEQEQLMDELNGINNYNPRYVELAQKQMKLDNDAQLIEDSLTSLSKRVVQISSFINKEVNEMNYNMDKTNEFMSERNIGQSRKYQQRTMTHVNNLAVMLSEVLSQMQQQMAQQMKGQQQCQNPQPGQGKQKGKSKSNGQKLGNMRKMQEQLNQQMEQMRQGMQQGKRPLSKELAKMAAQQQALRRALQELSDAKEAAGEKPSKELKEIQEMMDQTEEDLVNKRISNETLERQKEITTRLLEAEKAEREQEMSNERESQTAQQQSGDESQKAFEAYKRQRMKEIELLNTVPPQLNSYYKQKVKAYFEQLETP